MVMNRPLSSALALLVAASALDGQGIRPYRPGIDVLDYAITIDLPDTGSVIRGDATLIFRRTARVDTLVLDLRQLRVTRVLLEDRARRYVRTDSTILIPLPRGDSGTYRVRVVYTGPVTDGLIVRRDSLRRWTYFGDNWPNRARYWIPSVDHPSDKATVTWIVRAPRGRTVIANGALRQTQNIGTGRTARTMTRWREGKPIPPYLMVIGAGPLVQHDLGQTACGLAEMQRCVRQSVYVAPERRDILPGDFSQAGEMVRFFASRIAPYPYEKLAHVQSATRFGGMENASAIFYADGLFRRGRGVGEGLIAHETAHQWFGNSVTEREWPHLWLSEGFATYFAALWTQFAHRDSAFKAEMGRIRNVILADTIAVPNRPVIDTVETELLRLLNRNSYQKGGWVLHMLRSQLGDSAFFQGLRDYYARHKHNTAMTSDLQSSLEKASGKQLGPFFDQWLRRPGYPELDVSWAPDSTGRAISLTIVQLPRFGSFEFPIRLSLVDSSGAARRVEFAVPAQLETKLELPVSTAVARVDVDPDVQLLARITVRRQ
jgi:aminopeptidase N